LVLLARYFDPVAVIFLSFSSFARRPTFCLILAIRGIPNNACEHGELPSIEKDLGLVVPLSLLLGFDKSS